MAENKTTPSNASVDDFIDDVDSDTRRSDARTLLKLMKRVTGEEPTMWGSSIIGFGNVHYVYESGREGDWFKVGFSPRKGNLTLYVMARPDRWEDQLARLGKHKTGKGCLYINKLEDVDMGVLEELIETAAEAATT